MPSSQRQWKSQNQQQALTEFDLVRKTRPEGIYLCLTPGNFSLWSGVMFVRKGPYSPAILRFQLAFPQNYPEVAPLILFTNDVFHPLVTPLTTYTYSTSSSSADPVSATDEERLLPGGFSLRHGFPNWFCRTPRADIVPQGRSPPASAPRSKLVSQEEVGEHREHAPKHPSNGSVFRPPPKDEASSVDQAYPTIVEVLRYMKNVFEEDAFLDDLPVEAAGNPGAWHAWIAHRRKVKAVREPVEKTQSQTPVSRKHAQSPDTTRQRSWNWDGVWAERVKKGIGNSLADSTLYGGVDGDDLIHFLDVNEEASEGLRRPFKSRLPGVA